MIRAGYVEDAASFACHSVMCEWGYLVDFDEKRFEVYRGFQKEPHGDGRFANRAPAGEDWWPVRLVASWPFDALPDEEAFCTVANGNEEEAGD